MNEIYKPILIKALQDAQNGLSPYTELRKLPLSVFGRLIIQPNVECPELAPFLAKITPTIIQNKYNGRANLALLPSSVSFMDSVNNAYIQTYGKKLSVDSNILDYGFGWGRLVRMSYWFSDPDNVYGLDPQQASIDICHAHGLTKNLLLCDEVPTSLPIDNKSFDLIFSFSVFTHISYKSISAILKILLRYMSTCGMLAITIRPIEFWAHYKNVGRISENEYEELTRQHRENGFAYIPCKDWKAVNGEVHFGDTSMTLEFIALNWPEWRIVGNNLTLEDPFQLHVFLTPA